MDFIISLRLVQQSYIFFSLFSGNDDQGEEIKKKSKK